MNKQIWWGVGVSVVALVLITMFGYSAYTKQQAKTQVEDYLKTSANKVASTTVDADGNDDGSMEKDAGKVPEEVSHKMDMGTGTVATTTITKSSVDPATFTGSVALTSDNAKLAWIGRKTLVAGYEDAGKILVSTGSVSLVGGKITGASAVIDMNSIAVLSTGMGKGEDGLSHHLKSADFFDAEKFPTAEFKLVSAKETAKQNGSAQNYEFTGTLTMKGVTAPVTFTGVVTQNGNTETLVAETKIDRTKWGVNYGSSKVANAIVDDLFTLKISVNVVLK